MRKIYTAPSAEITVFAPTESIATSWTKSDAAGKDRWWIPTNGFNYWGEQLPSTANGTWYDFGEDEIK